ncbi:hypothetical protein [Nonomuraea sp. NPDC050643]|uniref:DUF7352 domain-containing protein n=1 Tax=Nonomuraea sp. NPDC050643 TaxID=3155660 RepID=UPI0033F0E65D
MARRMLRYQVVVGDRPKRIEIGEGWLSPARVEASRLGVGPNAQHIVEFWAEGDLDGPVVGVWLQVFGTGHPLPEGARWWGTTARTEDGFVWHLYEVPNEEQG